jgi:hypothetical protein
MRRATLMRLANSKANCFNTTEAAYAMPCRLGNVDSSVKIIVSFRCAGAHCCTSAPKAHNKAGAPWATSLAWARKKGHVAIEASLRQAGAQ